MYEIQNPIGRLMLVRTFSSLTEGEVRGFGPKFGALMRGRRVVTCADLRAIVVLAPLAADLFVENLRRDNPLVDRSALVLSQANAVFRLQVERMVRESGGQHRRAFVDTAAA